MIADDQPLMRAGFKAVLEATGSIEVVAEAGDGEEAIRAAEAHAPDVVLMDIRMPGVDGIEATRRLPRAARPDPHDVRPRRVHRRGAARRARAASSRRTRPPPTSSPRSGRSPRGDAVLSPRSPAACSTGSRRRLPAAAGPRAGRRRRLTEREREVLRLSRPGCRTRRSQPRSSSPSRRSRRTSRTCSASSVCATACRR